MPHISNDNPLYFLTSVTTDRLPVFRTDIFKQILANALNEARTSGGCKIFGYVIMPDHYHIVTDSLLKPSEVLRYLNGTSARRVINYLRDNEQMVSLEKLKKEEEGKKDYKYSLWEHHSNTFLITTESMLTQKVNYIHQNPVEDGLIEDADKYRYSSVRYWQRRSLLDDEPLVPDIKDLSWKK